MTKNQEYTNLLKENINSKKSKVSELTRTVSDGFITELNYMTEKYNLKTIEDIREFAKNGSSENVNVINMLNVEISALENEIANTTEKTTNFVEEDKYTNVRALIDMFNYEADADKIRNGRFSLSISLLPDYIKTITNSYELASVTKIKEDIYNILRKPVNEINNAIDEGLNDISNISIEEPVKTEVVTEPISENTVSYEDTPVEKPTEELSAMEKYRQRENLQSTPTSFNDL